MTLAQVKSALQNVSWAILGHAIVFVLSFIGACSIFAFFATCHYYLYIPCGFGLSVIVYLAYKLEFFWRTRRTFGEWGAR